MINTIYQCSQMQPNNKCVDLTQDTVFSAVMNGLQFDSYELIINDMVNSVPALYDSGASTQILNSNSGITYSGSWKTATNQTIDDNNSSIQYYGTGWATPSSTTYGYYGNSAHNSAIANDYFQYTFVGTGISVFETFGKDKGIQNISIDGVDEGSIDAYIANGTGINGNNMKVNAYTISNLAYSSHVIKITVLGTKNSSSTGALIEFDYFQVLNTNGSKNSSTAKDYLQYTFTSNGLNVYMDETPDSGTVEIFIDSVSKGITDLYSSTYNLGALAYTNTNLTNAQHIIKIVLTGNKNTQSTNCLCYFDYLEITNKTALVPMIYDKQLLSITLPENTITLRGALKWSITLWNSSNQGENISSGEMLFTNMSSPTNTMNTPGTITNKSFTFVGTYAQAENIPIMKYNYTLYGINYIINCGYLGQSLSSTGTQINCGKFGDIPNRYFIHGGSF